MKINIIQLGATSGKELLQLINLYYSRVEHYTKLEVITIPALKSKSNFDETLQKNKEWESIEKEISKGSKIILLDERGSLKSSVEFSKFLIQHQNQSVKEINFIIGGAFGFSEKAYAVAHEKLSLSKMTFSHQMVRLIFAEQLYRAFTIIKGEKYHHN